MKYRIGSAFAVVSALLAPLRVDAQVAKPAVWWGPTRPQGNQNAAPRIVPQAYGAHPPAHYRPGYAPAPYSPASLTTPAGYGHPTYASYGSPYPASYYGPSYAQGNQMGSGAWGAPRAEAPSDPVKTKDNLHYVELGMGAFIPTDSGNPAKLGLQANLWALHGGWVPNSGFYVALDASTGFDVGCMARSATDGCKGHLRIHWIGAGPFVNTGTPMIAADVPRSWDLMAMTGAEVRLWKGMTAKATINWFVPSPWGVYAHEKQLAEASLSGATAASLPLTSAGEAAGQNPVDGVESILGHALKHPQLNLMAMWEF